MAIQKNEVQGKHEVAPAPASITIQLNLLLTVGVGLAMLVIGVLAGYFGRPLIAPQPSSATTAAVSETSASVAPNETNQSSGNVAPQSIMDAVIAQTRHFKGDPNAPITIVEFGDFQ